LSTLSQLGLIIYRLRLGIPHLTLFHLYMHALFKALLFLCVGLVLILSFGRQDIRLLGGLLLKAPLLSIFFNLRTLCLIGIPFVNAYYTKHIILEVMMTSPLNILSLIGVYLGRVFTAAYIIRLILSLNWSHSNITLLAKPTILFNYWPLMLLGLGSLISGKILTSYDLNFVIINFIPNRLIWIVNLTALWGTLLGFILWTPKNAVTLRSLWWRNPIKLAFSSWGVVVQIGLAQLDNKWLRPKTSLSYLRFSGSKLWFTLNWPAPHISQASRMIAAVLITFGLCKFIF